MNIKEFLHQLQQLSLFLIVDKEDLILKGDSKKMTTEIAGTIRQYKSELIDYLSEGNEAADIQAIYRLSGLQQGILFHTLYEKGTGAYINQMDLELEDLQKDLFLGTWEHIFQQHSILRSGFYYDSFRIPVQCVYRRVSTPVEEIDLSGMDRREQDESVAAFSRKDLRHDLDLKKPPLMRITLFLLGGRNYRVIWTIHHLVFDGWSGPVLMKEFLETYECLAMGKEPAKIQEDLYEDHIRYLERRDKGKEEYYWRTYLTGIKEGTLLPFVSAGMDRNKSIQDFNAVLLQLDAGTTTRINQYAKQEHITVNTLMQGVWAFLLHRYTGSEQVVFGTTVSGRPEQLPGIEHRIGMYINAIPVRSVLYEDEILSKWLQSLQQAQIRSRQYQYSALTDIQGWTGLRGDLFDSLLIFQNYPVSEIVYAREWLLRVKGVQLQEQTSNYPLSLRVVTGEDIQVQFVYKDKLLNTDHVEMMKRHFEQVLDQMITGEELKLRDIALLTVGEERQLREGFNDTAVNYPRDKTIPNLLSASVLQTPESIAVVAGDAQLTYRELHERANRLGHYLRGKGIREEDRVAISLDRGSDMIIAILGVLKAGAAYVPIDPLYPHERIHYMLQDSAPAAVITAGWLEEHRQAIERQPDDEPRNELRPQHAAYVIYTSGSTGKPKGVVNEHLGVVNRLRWTQDFFGLGPEEAVLQKTTFCFDVSVWEMLWPLFTGARLVFARPDGQLDIPYLKKLIDEERITTLHFVPSMLTPFLEQTQRGECAGLQRVLCSGEALQPYQLRLFEEKLPAAALYNLYGPTEAAIDVSCWAVPVGWKGESVPIGKPVANTQLYVLDAALHLLPIGVTGELYIGGVQVAREYLHQPALTAERFIADPFSAMTGARLYRTGDLARLLPDGNLEYLGRKDDQVKIRGYRIELGEIEQVVLQSGLVKQAAVVAGGDNGSGKRLIGYIVPAAGGTLEAIRTCLAGQLPEYMLPSLWVVLEELPLTPSGKLDKKALPAPEGYVFQPAAYVAPRTESESLLVGIWQELLNVKQVGIEDNFFTLGGHSLLAMQLIFTIRRILDKEMSIKDIFENPTIASLAQLWAVPSVEAVLPPVRRRERLDKAPLSFAQERLWFIDRLQGSVQYNMPWLFRLTGPLDREALAYAFRQVLTRHEILRTVIREEGGIGSQQSLPAGGWKMDEVGPEGGMDWHSLVRRRIEEPFDLAHDYLLKVTLIALSDQEYMLLVLTHHIAFDGWSIGLVVGELVELYKAKKEGRRPVLKELPVQYADYAVWQRQHLSGSLLESRIEYWKQQLQGVQPLALPTDYPRPAMVNVHGGMIRKRIGKEITEGLTFLSRQEGVTLFMTLLAALQVLLYRYSGEEDICIGSPTAGRSQQELEGLVGFFINVLILRSRVEGQQTFRDLLQQVRKVTLDAYEHQDVPYEKIVDALDIRRDTSRNPLFQVKLALHNMPASEALDLSGVELTQEDHGQATAQIDIALDITPSPEGLSIVLSYYSELYKKGSMERLLDHYENLLRAVISGSDERIGGLELLTEAEREEVVTGFNATAAKYPRDKTVVGLFEDQVDRTPDAIAVVFEDQLLSYRQLDERANQLAHLLRSKGVKEESLVGICVERSPEMLIAIWGVLKAGGAYVPIDADYPEERVQYMLEDSGCRVVVTQSALRERVSGGEGPTGDEEPQTEENGRKGEARLVICPDDLRDLLGLLPADRVGVGVTASSLAYVIYTSGSTGWPKGVMIEQGSVVNLVYNQVGPLRLRPGIRVFQFASLSFDASCYEIFCTLLCGGQLELVSKETIAEPKQLAILLTERQVELITLPPSYQAVLAEEDVSIKTLISAGEALSAGLAGSLQQKGIRVINAYGPTENTVCSTLSEWPVSADGLVTIGKPLGNVQAYILDGERRPVPVGVTGELYLGGAQVARGYLHRPELTEERFIPDVFGQAGGRLYRTGDLARWLPDGNIVYQGRIDDQVKIRGYRIEPGEVEHVLQQAPGVRQSVVVASKDKHGDKRLIGYMTGEAIDREAIRSYLRERLPDHLIPSILITLEHIPLTPNGKIDRKQLRQPDDVMDVRPGYTAPRNPLEEQLAVIWQELLGVDMVGIYDNFFELGGHSLLAIRMMSAIEKSLHVEISVNTLFLFPNIADLARSVRVALGNTLTVTEGYEAIKI